MQRQHRGSEMRNRARISSATESEQGPHRVQTPQQATRDSPVITGEDRDDIGGLGEYVGREVAGRIEVTCEAKLTPPKMKPRLHNCK